MFAFTLAVGIVLLNSSYKSDTCGNHYYSSYNGKTGCGKLNAAVWCSFLSMATFAVTFFLSFASGKTQPKAQDEFVAGTSPTNNNMSSVPIA